MAKTQRIYRLSRPESQEPSGQRWRRIFLSETDVEKNSKRLLLSSPSPPSCLVWRLKAVLFLDAPFLCFPAAVCMRFCRFRTITFGIAVCSFRCCVSGFRFPAQRFLRRRHGVRQFDSEEGRHNTLPDLSRSWHRTQRGNRNRLGESRLGS